MNIYVKRKLMNNYFTRNIDLQLIILFFALTIFGLINLYSVDYKNLLVFNKQLKFSIAAVVSFTIIIIINEKFPKRCSVKSEKKALTPPSGGQ